MEGHSGVRRGLIAEWNTCPGHSTRSPKCVICCRNYVQAQTARLSSVIGWAPDALACLERLLLFGLTEQMTRPSEENELLAGDGADVVVHAQHLDAGDFLDHHFEERMGRFDQMGAY